MEKFVPKSKKNFVNQIKGYLLDGYVIRADFREDRPLEVMPRGVVHNLRTMHNIGMEKSFVFEEIFCDHDILHELIKELKKDYSVRSVRCEYSGCCQYSTYGYYID